jgi:excisionase family DNA binding protein
MAENNEWITRNETAKLLGVHPRTVDYYIKRGYLTKYADGLGRIRLSRAEVESKIKLEPAVVSSDR